MSAEDRTRDRNAVIVKSMGLGGGMTAQQLQTVGEIVIGCNQIEGMARSIGAHTMMGILGQRRGFDELLLGSANSIDDARRWLHTVFEWHDPPRQAPVRPRWFPEADEWLKRARATVERRNGLVHRQPATIHDFAWSDQPEATASGEGLLASRRTNSMLRDRGALDELRQDIERVLDVGQRVEGMALVWVNACMRTPWTGRLPDPDVARTHDGVHYLRS